MKDLLEYFLFFFFLSFFLCLLCEENNGQGADWKEAEDGI